MCGYCSIEFTPEEIVTGDPMYNEFGTLMHMGCYNKWCDENPSTYHQGVSLGYTRGFAVGVLVPEQDKALDAESILEDILDAEEIG